MKRNTKKIIVSAVRLYNRIWERASRVNVPALHGIIRNDAPTLARIYDLAHVPGV